MLSCSCLLIVKCSHVANSHTRRNNTQVKLRNSRLSDIDKVNEERRRGGRGRGNEGRSLVPLMCVSPFVSLPPAIGQLESLELLSVRNNNLVELPGEINNLHNLRVLDVHQNQLKALPSLSNLHELVELNLQCNNLSSVTKDFGRLTKLQRLQLGFNKFSTFPRELGELVNLVELVGVNRTTLSLCIAPAALHVCGISCGYCCCDVYPM